jgi:oxygen-independent coproporphyrinogen III oxidase
MQPYSLYLHVPFCQKRCSYCDFNTYAGQADRIPAYVSALAREVAMLGASAPAKLPVHTLFFGGGTPSLLTAPQYETLLTTIDQAYALQPGIEATLEANPGTVSLPYLQSLKAAGFNRISFGMQTADPGELSLLGRIHDFYDVIRAVKWARQAGFAQINLDLIFGLPFQTLETWQASLEAALRLDPEHLSLYALTVEHGTPLYRWVGRGLVPSPDGDLAADMYEWACQRLDQAGFVQYEISNWARTDSLGNPLVCRHNLQYWRNQPYLGFGAGAHGYAAGYRLADVIHIKTYVERMAQPGQPAFPFSLATGHSTRIDRHTEMEETMLVGLRLTQEGVSRRSFEDRFGIPVEQVFGKEIERMAQAGLLEAGEILRLTPPGRLLGNQVFMQFIDTLAE